MRRAGPGAISGVDVRDVPDVRAPGQVDHDGHDTPSGKEHSMALIQVTLIKGVFTTPQKQEIIERITDAMVAVEGENMRRAVWCVINEVAGDDWGIGGQLLIADDVKALARAAVESA
jgi:4-oxalocrotonate tautomerase